MSEAIIKAGRNLINNHLAQLVRLRQLEMAECYFDLTGGVVQSGPFVGMRLHRESVWHDGHCLQKLLGCYEMELHSMLILALSRDYRRVINVGAAEGHYAIGMALCLPTVPILAFETLDAARAIGGRAADLNGVSEHLQFLGHCSHHDLNTALQGEGRSLIIMDIEGGETDLLDPVTLPALAQCDVMVECHDFANRTITPTLLRRLADSHRLDRIEEGPRDPNRYEWLRQMNNRDRWLAMDELRPETMCWIMAWVK